MKSGIVLKLFILTSALCLFILSVVFIGQTVFFKEFYVHKKVKDIQAALQSYKKDYLKNAEDPQAVVNLELDFYQKHHTWITTLDAMGNLKHTGDFNMEIQVDSSDDNQIGRAHV